MFVRKNLPRFDRQSRTGERPDPTSPAPASRPPTTPEPPDAFSDIWNEMLRVLQRNLNDLAYIDYMCDCLGFPRFEIMRKEIEDVLEKARMVQGEP